MATAEGSRLMAQTSNRQAGKTMQWQAKKDGRRAQAERKRKRKTWKTSAALRVSRGVARYDRRHGAQRPVCCPQLEMLRRHPCQLAWGRDGCQRSLA